MPRKSSGRRKFRRYIRGAIDEAITVGALAANTGLRTVLSTTVVEPTWISSVDLNWAITDLDAVDDSGPVIAYIAHSDYSLTEIESWIETTTGSWDQGDLIVKEIMRRKIKRVGQFQQGGGHLTTDQMAIGTGRPVKTKLNWLLVADDTISLVIYNAGAVALGATPTLQVVGHANLWPKV